MTVILPLVYRRMLRPQRGKGTCSRWYSSSSAEAGTGNLISQIGFGVLMSRSFGLVWTERNRRKENIRYFPFHFVLFIGQNCAFFALPLIMLFQQCFETQNTSRHGNCLKLINILLPSPTPYHYFFPSSWFLSVWRETFESWYRCLICRL